MKKLLLLCIFSVAIFFCRSQSYIASGYRNLQVLEKELEQAKTPEHKTDALGLQL